MKQATTNNTHSAKTESSSLKDSLQQSLYIAALDRQIGIRGFLSSVSDGNLDYDFLHMKTGRFVKVFKELQVEEMARYEEFQPELAPIYILEASGLPSPPKEKSYTSPLINVLLFKNEALWEWEGEQWRKIPTIEMQRCLCALYNGDEE